MVSKLRTVVCTISGSWDYFAASFGDQKIVSPEMASPFSRSTYITDNSFGLENDHLFEQREKRSKIIIIQWTERQRNQKKYQQNQIYSQSEIKS